MRRERAGFLECSIRFPSAVSPCALLQAGVKKVSPAEHGWIPRLTWTPVRRLTALPAGGWVCGWVGDSDSCCGHGCRSPPHRLFSFHLTCSAVSILRYLCLCHNTCTPTATATPCTSRIIKSTEDKALCGWCSG